MKTPNKKQNGYASDALTARPFAGRYMHKPLSTLIVLCVLLHNFSSDAKEIEQCGYRTAKEGTVFTLTISRSFHGQAHFQLCERQSPEKSFVTYTTEKIISVKELTSKEYEEIYTLYESALEYDVKYAASGLDGSSWCLETKRRSTYSKACFWTPSSGNRENRGLSGLYKLGQKLWGISEFQLENEKLY